MMDKSDKLYVSWLDETDPDNGVKPVEWWETLPEFAK